MSALSTALRQSGASDITVFRAEADHAIGAWHNVFVVIWREQTTIAAATSVRQHFLDFCRRKRGAVFILAIVEPGARPPESEARRILAEALGGASGTAIASAVVLEGEGFRAALVRSVVTGLALVARQSYPHEVCSLQAAAELFEARAPAHGVSCPAASMLDGIERLRVAVADQAPASSRSRMMRWLMTR